MFDFERIIAGLFANEVSRFFTIAILAYLSFSILLLFRKQRGEKLDGLVDISPGILTSLGILGTFLGIFLGLMDFDIRTINRSVPELLEGLKVAFGTSILGLGGALIFRVARPLVASSSGEGGASAEDVLESLTSLNKKMETLNTSVETSNQTNKDGFDTLRKALTDDGNSSVPCRTRRTSASLSHTKHVAFRRLERARLRVFVMLNDYVKTLLHSWQKPAHTNSPSAKNCL